MRNQVFKPALLLVLFIAIILSLSFPVTAQAALKVTKTITSWGNTCTFTSQLINEDNTPATTPLSNAKSYYLETYWSNTGGCISYLGVRGGYVSGSNRVIQVCYVPAIITADGNTKRTKVLVSSPGSPDKEINKYAVPLSITDVNNPCKVGDPEPEKTNLLTVQGSLKPDVKPGTDPTKPPANAPTTPAHTPSNQNYYEYDLKNFDKPAGTLNNLLDVTSVPQFLVRLAKIVFILLGGVAAIVILVGAFRMAMSQGNAEWLTGAKRNITWAVIGLVVALLSYSIVAILQSFLGVN